MTDLLGKLRPYLEMARDWAVTPAAWGQAVALVVAVLGARMATRALRPILLRVLTPAEGANGVIALGQRQLARLMPLLAPLLIAGFVAVAEEVVRGAFGTGGILGFAKRFMLFLVVRSFVRDVLRDSFLRA